MWGKLRRKISRTKPAVEQDNTKEVVLNKSELVLSRENPSGCLYTDTDENGFSNQDGQSDCRCSPLLHFQKHFFGSFRSKKITEDCGERSADGLEGLKKITPELEDVGESTAHAKEANTLPVEASGCNGLELDINQTCDQPVEDGNSFELESGDAFILDWTNADAVGIRQTDEREILEDVPLSLLEDMRLPPPKLKRRERAKVLEDGESRIMCAESENNRCPRVHSDRAGESVALQRDISMLSTICESRSSSCIVNANAEAVCNSSHLEDAAANTLDCHREMVLLYKGDDKEESMDSGHHPSDGDVEKGHSSPDLDLDEFDGRESGYTTLDDVQAMPPETHQLSSYAACLGIDVDGCYDPSDCISAQLDTLALQSAQDWGISSTLGNEPTARCFCTPAWLHPLDSLAFSSDDVISSVQLNSDLPASFPIGFGSIDGRTVRQWEHVDYVPADASVSKIYEDSSNSGINDVYASVPRYCVAKFEEGSVLETVASEERLLARRNIEVRSSNWSAKDDDVENRSLAGFEAGRPASSHAVLNGPTDEWNGAYPDLSSAALDSDDGENVPPVPSRNYESYIDKMNVELGPQNCEESHECIHMSWEEVMREARFLGIPLNRPQTEKPYRVPFSEQLDQSDSVMPHFSEAGRIKCSMEQASVCCVNPAAKGKNETKKGSPFKEKFRLPNPFSRRNKLEHNESFTNVDGGRKSKHLHGMPTKGKKSSIFRHHSSIDIQKRCLPRPPPADAYTFGIDCGRVSRASSQSGGSQRMAISLHLQFPSEPSANQSQSWGSSSNILRVSSTGCRSRRVFSDSLQWPNSSESLPFSDNGDGTVVGLDSSSLTGGTNGNADFIQSFSKLKDCGWYWGPLGWENAEAKLENKPDGSFLVRDSSDDRYILSLSFRSQNMTHHTRIEHYKGMFSFYSQPKSHGASTIVEFIEKAMEHSRSGKFLYFLRPRAPGLPPAPVQLLFPISRLRNMHSLQHICRFVILRHVRLDLIDRLPIPPRLKEYLKESQYYIEYSDCDSMGHQYFSQEW